MQGKYDFEGGYATTDYDYSGRDDRRIFLTLGGIILTLSGILAAIL